MIPLNNSGYNSTLHNVGWSCVLNYFMLLSLPCFYAFADLLHVSLHLVTYILVIHCMSVLLCDNNVLFFEDFHDKQHTQWNEKASQRY